MNDALTQGQAVRVKSYGTTGVVASDRRYGVMGGHKFVRVRWDEDGTTTWARHDLLEISPLDRRDRMCVHTNRAGAAQTAPLMAQEDES